MSTPTINEDKSKNRNRKLDISTYKYPNAYHIYTYVIDEKKYQDYKKRIREIEEVSYKKSNYYHYNPHIKQNLLGK